MSSPSSNLWGAAKANDLVQLARLLDDGAPIDEPDHRGYSPLMLAGYAGNLEAVELLLVRGADPNTRDLFGNTVLMGAAYKGFVGIVERLLLEGADPEAINHGGLDARGFALTYGHDDVFEVLDHHAQRVAAFLAPLPRVAPPHPPLQASAPQPARPHHTN
jgi:ankyrin repeat protein